MAPQRPAQGRSARPARPTRLLEQPTAWPWVRKGLRRFARAPMGRTDWRSAARCRGQQTRQRGEIAVREESFAFQTVRSAARAPSQCQIGTVPSECDVIMLHSLKEVRSMRDASEAPYFTLEA